ncbi:MAG: thioredoxin family protein [Spirochaetales bacterium]|nr:thioredoxin family protein [Spirochaetales bacterium]MCF7939537.1 thioredoxin family protein [Spirochaetales bacterium]
MPLLEDSVKDQVRELFSDLDKQVNLKVFTQKIECQYCADTHQLVEEIGELSQKITVEVLDFEDDKATADKYNVDKIPAVVAEGEKDYGIRFYGIPGGYEFTSLMEAIRMISLGEHGLSEETKAYLDGLDQDLHLQVFVTPSCPYCPRAVVLAHKMAYYSDRVTGDMVEVTEFPHLGNKYSVQGVPRTVINENDFQEGAAPEQTMLEKIKSALA